MSTSYKLAPDWLHKSEQPGQQVDTTLDMTTTHKFPPQRAVRRGGAGGGRGGEELPGRGLQDRAPRHQQPQRQEEDGALLQVRKYG